MLTIRGSSFVFTATITSNAGGLVIPTVIYSDEDSWITDTTSLLTFTVNEGICFVRPGDLRNIDLPSPQDVYTSWGGISSSGVQYYPNYINTPFNTEIGFWGTDIRNVAEEPPVWQWFKQRVFLNVLSTGTISITVIRNDANNPSISITGSNIETWDDNGTPRIKYLWARQIGDAYPYGGFVLTKNAQEIAAGVPNYLFQPIYPDLVPYFVDDFILSSEGDYFEEGYVAANYALPGEEDVYIIDEEEKNLFTFYDAVLTPPTTWIGYSEVSADTSMTVFGGPGAFSYPSADTTATFTGTKLLRTTYNFSADTTAVISPRNLISASASISADFATSIQPKLFLGDTTLISADSEFTRLDTDLFLGFAIDPMLIEISADFLANVTYDIGISYAGDYTEPDYISPQVYYTLFTESDIYIAATVEHIPEANIFADSDINVNGGYLTSTGNLLLNGDTQIVTSPRTTIDVGITWNPSYSIASEFSTNYSGGRIFRPTYDIAVDSQLALVSGRIQQLASSISADTSVDAFTRVFGGAVCLVSCDTNLVTQPGKFLPVSLALSDDFRTLIRTRIISIDEYYLDKVFPETRRTPVPLESRTFVIDDEFRIKAILPEIRVAEVAGETRRTRPEVGVPINTGRRQRRLTQ